MKKLFAVVVLMMLVWHHAFSLDLNITLSNAGDLINQVDVSKLDEVESLTIAGDLNGTDILIIRKMVNLQTLDMSNANIVNGGNSYYEDYITSENVIGAYFFIDNTKLVSVKLPKTATSIGDKVFSGCTMLENVSIGDCTTSIGEYVFEDCAKLPSITIPQNVLQIDNFAFKGCSSLKVVIIKDGTEKLHMGNEGYMSEVAMFVDSPLETLYLGRDVIYKNYLTNIRSPFAYQNKLSDVKIGKTVSLLHEDLFFDCDAISIIELPDGLKTIGGATFAQCDNLASISIPKSVELIDQQAFWQCNNLEEITIEGSPTIGMDVFQYCYKLNTIHIKDIILWMGIVFKGEIDEPYHLFLNGKEVVDLIVPSGIEVIGEFAFFGCQSMKTITIPQSVKTIKPYAFSHIADLRKITIEDGDGEIEGCIGDNSLVDTLYLGRDCGIGGGCKVVIIGDKIEKIRENAFEQWKHLESISFGKGVKEVNYHAFRGCVNLKSVYIQDMRQWLGFSFIDITDNPTYYAKHLYLNEVEVKDLIIPNGIEAIGNNAFVNCQEIESVLISNGVISIGTSAFRGCKKLGNIETPNTLKTIGDYALMDCENMVSAVLGNNLISIGKKSFTNCYKLGKITSLNTTPPVISESTFDESTEKSATLYVPIGCKNIYWLHPYWENFAKIEEMEFNEDITEKKSEAIVKYNEGIALYNNYMEFDSNVRSAYDQLESQQNYNRKLGDEIEWEISELKGKVEASDFDTELKAYFLNVLDSIDNAKYGYVKWTYEYGYDYLISELNNAKKEFESYAERLEGYKSSIESATTNAELEAIIEQMGIDNSNMETEYRSSWETDYNSLLQFIDSCEGYEAELLKLLQRLKDLKTEFDNITSGIDTIASTDGNIIVYTLKGERITMKSILIKTLPKGIYIINGKKHVLK